MARDLQNVSQVDRVIHEPARLIIMSVLCAVESADFLYLLRETGLSKGNLSSHLARLEEASYITIDKSFRGKIPQTTCCLTELGWVAFREYRETIRRAIDATPE